MRFTPPCPHPLHPPPPQVLERESARERNLEKAAKEARAKARKEAARTAEPLDPTTDEDLAQVGGGAVKAAVASGAGRGRERPGARCVPQRWCGLTAVCCGSAELRAGR